MAAAHPFQPAELEEALRKVAKREPLTHDEREIIVQTVDELVEARAPIDPEDAPLDDEPTTAEDLAAIAEARAEIARGEVFTSDDVRRRLGL